MEDLNRNRQDAQRNAELCPVLKGDKFVDTCWKDIRVGDFIKVTKDHTFPADFLILCTEEPSGPPPQHAPRPPAPPPRVPRATTRAQTPRGIVHACSRCPESTEADSAPGHGRRQPRTACPATRLPPPPVRGCGFVRC